MVKQLNRLILSIRFWQKQAKKLNFMLYNLFLFRKAFFISCLLAGAHYTFGQQIPVIQKKMYQSDDGKLYINKALPVYLFIGTDPDNTQQSVRLQSQATKAYTNPMYFDTEGINTIQSPWCVDTSTKETVIPKRNIIFEVYADSRPPITRISFGKSRTLNKKGKIHLSGNAEITLTASDELSGVDKIMYSINNEDYKEYSSPFILEDEKEYTLQYFSYDRVGNVEDVHKIILVIDKSSPKVRLEIKGDTSNNVLGVNASLSVVTDEDVSGIEQVIFKLNDEIEKPFTKTIQAAMLPQGEHTIEYYAVDQVGNTSEKQSYTFYVDKTPPTVMPEIIGKTYMINGKEFSSGRSQLKLTAIDNRAGIKEIYYSINNSEYQKYEKPVTLHASGGKLTVKLYAIDKVNNRIDLYEGTESTSLPYVDLTGPKINYQISSPYEVVGDTFIISRKTKIKLTAIDPEAGVKEILYSLNKNEMKKFEQAFSIDSDGFYLIDISAIDNVDNINNTQLLVIVDNQGPSLYSLFSAPSCGSNSADNSKVIQIYPQSVGLFISATDNHAGYDKMFYSLNNSPLKQFTGFLTNFFPKNQLKVIAYDKLGNQSELHLSFETVNYLKSKN